MSIELQVETHRAYVHIHCRGFLEHDAMLDVWRRVFEIAVEKGLNKVLVDVRELEGDPPSTMHRYDYGVSVAKLQREMKYIVKIAVVGNVPIIDPGRFGETVALNRGAQGRVFTDVDKAIEWISSAK